MFAIRDTSGDPKVVNLFGVGVYVGDEVPPERESEVGAWVEQAREIDREILAEDPGEALAVQRGCNTANASLGGTEHSEEALVGFVQAARDKAEHNLTLDDNAYAAEIRRNPIFGNPKIELDGGGVVWGYQCWWGAEDKLDGYRTEGYEIVTVGLPDPSATEGGD